MSLPSPKICRRIRALFAAIADPNENVAKQAREKLLKLLAEHALNWSEIPDIIKAADEDDRVRAGKASHQPHGPPSSTAGAQVNVFDLVCDLVEMHVAVTPEERVASALWILHSHVFDRFDVTPRLAALSPVRGCGKTTLLMLVEQLVAESFRSDNTSAAALYYLLDRQAHTLLIDEGDNLGLLNDQVLRSVFNSGHRRGGGISRYVSGRSRKFPTFAPLMVAAIGDMPLPLLHRAVIVNMQRSAVLLTRFDERNPMFAAVRREISRWAADCKLDPEPTMPPALRNRAADNWRVLLAIADNLDRGEIARQAAVTLNANRPDEDARVLLLSDIRTIFDRFAVDRLTSATLIEGLLGFDDGMWADWRGPNDDRPPRKLNQADMARLLRPFGIRPRTIWPTQRRADSRSSRGYLREQFEAAWASYCPPADTPTHPSKIIHLASS